MINLYIRSYQARRWIKLVVLPSFLPIALVVLYDTYLGYTFKNIINRHLLDFLLVIFAIAVSVFGSAMILYKSIKMKKSDEKVENHIIISIFIGLFCSLFFTLLYDEIGPEDKLTPRKIIFCLGLICMTLFLVYRGMQSEEELESLSPPPPSPPPPSSLNTGNKQP